MAIINPILPYLPKHESSRSLKPGKKREPLVKVNRNDHLKREVLMFTTPNNGSTAGSGLPLIHFFLIGCNLSWRISSSGIQIEMWLNISTRTIETAHPAQ
jgi:hypothetical protein